MQQTHIGKGFGIKEYHYWFQTNKGYNLNSGIFPKHYRSYPKVCYVRGADKSKDNTIIEFHSYESLRMFVEAVLEYNMFFGNIVSFNNELDRILNI